MPSIFLFTTVTITIYQLTITPAKRVAECTSSCILYIRCDHFPGTRFICLHHLDKYTDMSNRQAYTLETLYICNLDRNPTRLVDQLQPDTAIYPYITIPLIKNPKQPRLYSDSTDYIQVFYRTDRTFRFPNIIQSMAACVNRMYFLLAVCKASSSLDIMNARYGRRAL